MGILDFIVSFRFESNEIYLGLLKLFLMVLINAHKDVVFVTSFTFIENYVELVKKKTKQFDVVFIIMECLCIIIISACGCVFVTVDKDF